MRLTDVKSPVAIEDAAAVPVRFPTFDANGTAAAPSSGGD